VDEHLNTLPQQTDQSSPFTTDYTGLDKYRGECNYVHAAYTQGSYEHTTSQGNQDACSPQRRDNNKRSNKIISINKALEIDQTKYTIDRETLLGYRTQIKQTQPPFQIQVKQVVNNKQHTAKRKKRKIWIKTTNTSNSNLNSQICGHNSKECRRVPNKWNCLSAPPRGTPGVQDSVKWKQIYLRFPRKQLKHTCNEHKQQKENLNVPSNRSENRRKTAVSIDVTIKS